jgi:hypothetical protein
MKKYFIILVLLSSLVPKLTKTGCSIVSISSLKAQSSESDDYNNDHQLPEVEVTAQGPQNDWQMPILDVEYPTGNGQSQSGGGGSPTPPTPPPPPPPPPCAIAISPDISSLFRDQGLSQPIIDLKDYMKNNTNEKGFTISEGNNGYIIDSKCTASTSGHCTMYYNLDTEASVHSHPNNGTFSPQDLYVLIDTNIWNNHMTDSYILCADGSVYNLHIDDFDAAYNFFQNFPGTNPDGSFSYSTAFGRDFLETQQAFSNTEGLSYDPFHTNRDIDGGFAWAYVLNQYNVGVSISKQESDGSFKKLNAEKQTDNGENKYVPSKCE